MYQPLPMYSAKTGLLLLIAALYFMPSQAQQPLRLAAALQMAKANNPVLKSLHYNTDLAIGDVITAGLRPNPNLNNQTLQSVNASHFAPGTKFYQPENRQVWWQLTKPFQLSHQRQYKLDVANKNVVVTENNYTDAERNLLFAAGNKWLDVWFSQVNLDLISAAKINIDSLVRTQQLRFNDQVISKSELTRTQMLSEQYGLQLKTAEQDFRNELKNLQLLLGNTDSVSIDIQDSITSLSLAPELDSLLQIGRQQRADLLAATNTIALAKSNIQLQHALSRPVPEMGVIWNPQNTIPYFGFFGTIALPIFSRNQGEIKKSKIALVQSEQSQAAVQQQMQTEVQTAFNSYLVSKNNLERYAGILKKAEEVLQSVQYAYTRGGTTIIDFLDAQRTWFDTQKMYYEAMLNYRKNYLQVLFVTGLINQL